MGVEETIPDWQRSAQPGDGERLAAISNLVVKVFADHMGRGPTKVRSYIVEDVVVCLLEDTLTKAERELMSSGNEAIVLKTRAVFQQTMRAELSPGSKSCSGAGSSPSSAATTSPPTSPRSCSCWAGRWDASRVGPEH